MRVHKRCSLKYKIKRRKYLLFLIKIEGKIKLENVITMHDINNYVMALDTKIK